MGFYGVAECGESLQKVTILDKGLREIGSYVSKTAPKFYPESVEFIALKMRQCAGSKLAAASIAVAAQVQDGVITRAGELTPWIGKRMGDDLAQALDLPLECVGLLSDIQAVAKSQLAANRANDYNNDGIVTSLDTHWTAAHFKACGEIRAADSGHYFSRGVGVSVETWLKDPAQTNQFVADLALATVTMIERHRDEGLMVDEIRWTGGIAIGQSLLMHQVQEKVSRKLCKMMPIWDSVTRSDAQLHGAFVDAALRAKST